MRTTAFIAVIAPGISRVRHPRTLGFPATSKEAAIPIWDGGPISAVPPGRIPDPSRPLILQSITRFRRIVRRAAEEIVIRHAAIAGASPHSFEQVAGDVYRTSIIRNDAIAFGIGFAIDEQQKCPPVDFVYNIG